METANTPIAIMSAGRSNLIVRYIVNYISLDSNSPSFQNWLISVKIVIIMGLIGQS